MNPWGREDIPAERAVLLALLAEAEDVPAIAGRAGVAGDDAQAALRRLVEEHVAIRDGDLYELTGPLSWFGSFERALRYHAGKNLLVTILGEAASHLYVCDVRVKGGRPSGDPLTETVSVLGCGRIASAITQAAGDQPACEDCKRVRA
jgi:hypothetical protein